MVKVGLKMLGKVGDYNFNKTTHDNLKVHVDVTGKPSVTKDDDEVNYHVSQSDRLHQGYEDRYRRFSKLMQDNVPLTEIATILELSEITLHSQRYMQRYKKHGE